jgi:hypothetical protein
MAKDTLTPEQVQKLQEDLATAKLELETALQTNTQLLEQIAQQSAATPEAEKPAEKIEVPSKPFTIDKVEYVCVIPKFNHNGTTYTANDVLADKALQQDLLAMGSSVIQLKNKQKQ